MKDISKTFAIRLKKLNNQNNKKGRPPFIIISLFFLLLIFFGYAALKNQGINPLFVFEKIIADKTNSNNIFLSQQEIAAGTKVEEDAYGRCRIINPLSKTKVVKKVSEGGASSLELEFKGGTNQGNLQGVNDEIQFLNGGSPNSTKTKIDQSYLIHIFINPNDYGAAVNFIKDANNSGYMPIVRLCYIGKCEFNLSSSAQDLIDFYTKINNQLSGSDAYFIGIVGPNEPGTGTPSEMSGFIGANDYTKIISRANEAAAALQNFRVDNGGNMYIAPAALNITNRQANDAKEYLYTNHSIKPELFDYIIGNSYDLAGGNGVGPGGIISADFFYTQDVESGSDGSINGDRNLHSVKNYILNTNDKKGTELQFIFTEFGSLVRPGAIPRSTIISNLKKSYLKLCQDDTVDGLLFFRNYVDFNGDNTKDNSGNTSSNITTGELDEMMRSCSDSPKKSNKSKWLSCNSLTALHEDNIKFTGQANSPGNVNPINLSNSSANISTDSKTATPFLTKFEKSPDYYNDLRHGAGLKVSCSGIDCFTKATTTIQVLAPLKSAGNNSPFGTKNKPYVPICPYTAFFLQYPDFDPLNQFSGQLIDKEGFSYPMPWLGSAINCASQFLLASPNFARLSIPINSNPGGLSLWAPKETKSDIDRNNQYTGPLALPFSTDKNYALTASDNITYIPDQRGTAILDQSSKSVDKIYNNDFSLNEIQSLRSYDPYNLSKNFKTPADTNPNNMQFILDKKDYIPGPELMTNKDTTVWSNTGGEVCRLYSQRNSHPSVDPYIKFNTDIKCGFVPDAVIKQYTKIDLNGNPIIVKELCRDGGGDARSCCGNNLDCTQSESFKKGNCTVDPSHKVCFEYKYTDSDKVFVYTNNYSPTPEYSVPKIFDGIYRLYQNDQSALSQRNLKFIFSQNLGSRYQVDSIIRDSNIKIDNAGPYLFKGTPEEYDPGNISSKNLAINGNLKPIQPDNMIDNTEILAKGNPRKKQFEYFDWLGYFDYLQEINVSYLNNTYLPSEQHIKNPFYDASVILKAPTVQRDDYINKVDSVLSDSNIKFNNSNLNSQTKVCIDGTKSQQVTSVAEDILSRITKGWWGYYNQPTPDSPERIRWDDTYFKQTCGDNNPYCNYPIAEGSYRRKDMYWCDQLITDVYKKVFNINIVGSVPGMYGVWKSKTGSPIISFDDANTKGWQNNPIPVGSAVFYSVHHIAIVCKVNVNASGNGSMTICQSNDATQEKTYNIVNGQLQQQSFAITSFGLPPADINNQGTPICSTYNQSKTSDLKGISSIEEIPNQSRPEILVSEYTSASKYLSSPILTCDQVQICKKYGFNDLKDKFGEVDARKLCPLDDKITSDKNINCVTDSTGPLSDQRFDSGNLLEVALCKKGYSLDSCKQNKVCNPSTNNKGGNSGNIDSNDNGQIALINPLPPEVPIKITTDYGTISTYIDKDKQEKILGPHSGIDFSVPIRTPVLAAAKGVVIEKGGQAKNCWPGNALITSSTSSTGSCLGLYIKIKHNFGNKDYYTYYLHLDSIKVEIGAIVNAGDLIGYSGNSGLSSGPHLHFALMHLNCDDGYYEGNHALGYCTMDPKPYFNKIINPNTNNTNTITLSNSSNSEDCPPNQSQSFANIFSLIDKVSQSTNVPKGVLASVMSTESRAVFSQSIGDVIKNSNGKVVSANPLVLTGDPNQRAMDYDNSAGARGVMQALCPTLLTYGYPQGNYTQDSIKSGDLPCNPWGFYSSDGKLILNYGAIGRNYDEVIKCVKDIGMKVTPGMHLDRGLVGHSLCIGAIELKYNQGKGKDMNSVDINAPFNGSNAIWLAAYAYNPLDAYANQIWGRSNIFKIYWDKFISGEYGENEIWGPSHSDNSYYCTLLKDKGLQCN